MIDIRGILVSEDVATRFFCCDLEACRGACCIEGDAGAPLTEAEAREIANALPEIKDELLPRALDAIGAGGVAYRDPEGDLVTQLLDGANCAFSCFGRDGVCLCAIEKARREGRTKADKPVSCALYPIRVTEKPGFTALNVHRWKICKPAEVRGRRIGMRVFEFLREPLIRRFGREWYEELAATCREYLRIYG